MAHLWTYETSNWAALPLAGDEFTLLPALRVQRAAACDAWVVVGPPAVHVNGVALDTGIRVLRDRDELRAGGRRAFFSTESLAVVAAFPGAERAVSCPRCKLEIVADSPAVRCPKCDVWHHQTDELPCFTYRERCTLCDQPSALDGGFRWTPEEL